MYLSFILCVYLLQLHETFVTVKYITLSASELTSHSRPFAFQPSLFVKIIFVKAEQPENVSAPILLVFAGILMALSEEQFRKAAEPIDLRYDGSLIPLRLVQSSNAEPPISVILLPKITVSNFVHPMAVDALIEVSPVPSLKLKRFLL